MCRACLPSVLLTPSAGACFARAPLPTPTPLPQALDAAQHGGLASNEARVLRQLHAAEHAAPGIVQLLGSFEHTRPGGQRYSCLVLERLGSTAAEVLAFLRGRAKGGSGGGAAPRRGMPTAALKNATRQLLMALDHCHRWGKGGARHAARLQPACLVPVPDSMPPAQQGARHTMQPSGAAAAARPAAPRPSPSIPAAHPCACAATASSTGTSSPPTS